MKKIIAKAMTLILMPGLLSMLLIVFSSSPVRAEASADLLGRYSCSHVKKWAESAPEELFKMWANSDKFGSNSAKATEIIIRGDLQGILNHIGDINTLIQGLEEAVSGDPKKVAEIFANWLLGKALTMTGSGVPGAVWTVCTELNTFAIALNEEILDLNINTFAQFAEKDPRLLGPDKVEYFLNDFLKMDESTGLFTNLRKKRSTFYEYAKVKLGHKNFPPMSEWRNKDNWNMVRSTASSMLNEVNSVVVKRKKFRQIQGELRKQLDALKQEQAVVTTFQAMRNQVLAMTCQDTPSKECLDVYNLILGMMNSLTLDAGDINGASPGILDSLKASADSLYRQLEGTDRQLENDYKLKVTEYCTAVKAGLDSLKTTISLAKASNPGIAARAVRAKGYMNQACASTTLTEAKSASDKAKGDAAEAVLLSNLIPMLPNDLDQLVPPVPIDFSGIEAELSGIEQGIVGLDKSILENFKKWEAFRGAAGKIRGELNTLRKACGGDTLIDGIAIGTVSGRIEGKIKNIESQVPDIRYENNTLGSISRKLGEIRSYLSGLKARHQTYGECLADTPDTGAMAAEAKALLVEARDNVAKAENYAALALACYNKLKNTPQCVSDSDCPKNYVCEDGKCVEAPKPECTGDTDCPAGYVCENEKCVEAPQPECMGNNDCPRDHVCKNGKCVYQKPSGCTSDGDCPQGYVCEQGSGRCVSPFDGSYTSFTGDMTTRDDQRSQNQADQTANDQNAGQSGTSITDLTQNIGNVHGQVSKDCYKNSDCPSGYHCKDGQCVEITGCRSDGDCPSGHTCESGNCVPVPAQPSTAQADPDPQPDPQTAASSLAISPPNKVITKSESVAFKASLVKGDGSTEDVTAKASWNPSQNFSSTKIGTHTITATFQNLSASAGVTVVEEKGLGDITVSEKTITVTFWDHGQEDGDMIDINVNGKAVFSGITLTNAPQTRTITMTAGALVFGFTALNEGSVSPNTATVKFTSVVAGKAEQKYSLKKNAKANMNVTYAPK